MPTTAYRATLDAYDGSPARSWCCGRNGWRDGIVEEARSTGTRLNAILKRHPLPPARIVHRLYANASETLP